MQDRYVNINGRMYKKPTKGRCAYCGSDMLEFYDDGSGICLNCGRTFSWLNPLPGPVKPKTQAGAPTAAAVPPQQRQDSPPKPTQTYKPPKVPKTGILSVKGITALGLLSALLIGIGAIILIATLPMGSWPPEDFDRDTLGNMTKAAIIIWAAGTMLFLMAGFAAAGTDELDPNVRRTLISASVALAILSFSLWIGMKFISGL